MSGSGSLLDSFFIEVGFKADKKSQQEVEDSLQKTRASSKKTGDAVEDSGKKSTESMRKLYDQVLLLFGLFTAGKGIKDFVTDIVSSNANLGRLAVTLDSSVQQLGAWAGAGAQVGASSQEIIGSFQALTSDLEQLTLTGQSRLIPFFRALGIAPLDARGRLKDMGETFLELADRFHAMDPARAAELGREMGLSPGMINLLIQGRAAVEGYLATAKKYALTDKDAKAAQDLQQRWAVLTQSSTALGRTLLTDLTPALDKVLGWLSKLSDWSTTHGSAVKAFMIGLGVAAAALAIALAIPAASTLAMAAAFGAVGAALYLLYEDWKKFTSGAPSSLSTLWKFIQPILVLLKDYIKVLGDAVRALVALFVGSPEEIRAAWGQLGKDLYQCLQDWGKMIISFGPEMVLAFKKAFDAAFSWLEGRANAIWQAIFHKDLVKKMPEVTAPKSAAPAPKSAADTVIDQVLKHEDSTLSGKITTDKGGLTKYGISQRANPGVDVKNLTVDDARSIYKKSYWDKIHGDSLPANIQSTAMDAAVNQGVGTALKWLQESGGNVDKFNALRRQRYLDLARADPKGAGKELAGWLSRLPAPGVVTPQVGAPGVVTPQGGTPGAVTPQVGAPQLAAAGARTDSHASTSTAETHIGTINIQTQATDPAGIASGIKGAIEREGFTQQANFGPA